MKKVMLTDTKQGEIRVHSHGLIDSKFCDYVTNCHETGLLSGLQMSCHCLCLSVLEPVSSPVIMPISLTVTEGSDLYLLCKVQQGTQPITFRWYHNGILIPSSTQEVTLLHGTHIVKAIEREQRGRYYCEATNHASETKKSPPVTITGVFF